MATRLETATPQTTDHSQMQELAKRHLWMHFTRMGTYADHELPVIVKGDGCYVWDENGKRYLDGLSALFCVNAGHGRAELGAAAAEQAKELGFFTNWSYAHPRSIELAARVAGLAPDAAEKARDLAFSPNGGAAPPRSRGRPARVPALPPGAPARVFFTNGGSGAVEPAIKLPRHWHRIRGEGQRHKLIARDIAYH